MIEYRCSCGNVHHIPDAAVGKAWQCYICGQPFIVPRQGATAQPPPEARSVCPWCGEARVVLMWATRWKLGDSTAKMGYLAAVIIPGLVLVWLGLVVLAVYVSPRQTGLGQLGFMFFCGVLGGLIYESVAHDKIFKRRLAWLRCQNCGRATRQWQAPRASAKTGHRLNGRPDQ